MSGKKLPPMQLFNNQDGCRSTEDLIEEGRYKQLAELFQHAQAASRQSGNGFLADLLAAANHICIACEQSLMEATRHQQAYEEASKRAGELKQQLYSLLNFVTESGPSDSIPAADKPQIILTAENSASSATLSVYCLGPFRVFRKNRLISCWSSFKSLALFKCLIKHHQTPIAKEVLMDLFWPDADSEAARRNLHQAIYSLRQTLRQGESDFFPIQFVNDCYSLHPDLKIWIDYLEFEKHWKTGRQLEEVGKLVEAAAEYSIAENIYCGDFLEEDLYEEWASSTREKYRNAYLDLADRLSMYFQNNGNFAAAIDLCQKILAKDNCHEKAHRRLMQCYQSQGEQQRAVRQYKFCVNALKQELGVLPSAETRTLFEKIMGAIS